MNSALILAMKRIRMTKKITINKKGREPRPFYLTTISIHNGEFTFITLRPSG